MAESQARLQSLSEEFTQLQQELQAAIQSRQKLEAQKQENTNVQKVSYEQYALLLLTHSKTLALTQYRNSNASRMAKTSTSWLARYC